ncbi:unnamed protein product [Cuscuta campestris]|uniref:Putative plant transposon protein domain-containing protein n=1 Tax=Cuscuta campestris TaxID=132261 RepID=A0A484MDC3_9ASTE|nr:unnamed protein product [Cuscuta campestris]
MAPRKRLNDDSSSSQPARFTKKAHESWYELRKEKNLVVEKIIHPDIDRVFRLTEAFRSVGWERMLTLSGEYFPDLVREFYANILNKEEKSRMVKSSVRGTPITLTLDYLREFLNLRDPRAPFTYTINRNGFVADDHNYDIEATKTKFGCSDMRVRDLGLRWIRARLLIYLFGFNIEPRASGLNEIRISDLYPADKMIFGLGRPERIALAPLILRCIHDVVASNRPDKNFVFPVLLS